MPRINETTDGPLPTTTEVTASSLEGGRASLADMARRLAPHCARSASRQRVMASLQGLLSAAERQNRWQVADICGEPAPYGFQYLLHRADWDADAVRDALRRSIIPHLGDPHAVLVLDETGFVNKGRHSAGVARQSTGTVGEVENCQRGVLLGYASPLGQALPDRALSLPPEGTDGRGRCQQAGIPGGRGFATKPQLARAFAAGVPATWVTGASGYGANRRLGVWLEAQPQASVLAVSGQEDGGLGWHHRRVKPLRAALPEEGWARLSAGDGAQGPRWYDWCWRPLAAPLEPGWGRWWRVRRSSSAPADLTASMVFAPQAAALEAVVPGAAGRARAVLRRPRGKWAWSTMQCGPGPAGSARSPSPWGRWPC